MLQKGLALGRGEAIISLRGEGEDGEAAVVLHLQHVAAELVHLVVGDVDHLARRPQLGHHVRALRLIANGLPHDHRKAGAYCLHHVGVIDGTALPVHRVVRHHLLEAELVRPLLGKLDIGALRHCHVRHPTDVVQHQAARSLQVPGGRLLLRHGEVEHVLVVFGLEELNDVLAALQLTVGDLHGVERQGVTARAEPIVGEARVGGSVQLGVGHQVHLESGLLRQDVVQAVVFLQHLVPDGLV
mmetsp:Transcript_25105/g.54623  ORF Transcript_25105/g.54623 Transcript_25105/m.54623 type:complete len:242 (-) Transcript_25105:694-1419(-)